MKFFGGVLIALLMIATSQSSAQDDEKGQTQNTAIPLMKVCSPKNPPPCATPPHALSAPDPEYDEEARQARVQGTVVLWAVISEDGLTEDVRVQRSLHPGLDRKAIEAVRRWKFKPATFEGNPVKVQVNIQVNFRLYKRPGVPFS